MVVVRPIYICENDISLLDYISQFDFVLYYVKYNLWRKLGWSIIYKIWNLKHNKTLLRRILKLEYVKWMSHHMWQNEKCIQCNAKSSKQNVEYGYNYNNICACMGKNEGSMYT